MRAVLSGLADLLWDMDSVFASRCGGCVSVLGLADRRRVGPSRPRDARRGIDPGHGDCGLAVEPPAAHRPLGRRSRGPPPPPTHPWRPHRNRIVAVGHRYSTLGDGDANPSESHNSNSFGMDLRSILTRRLLARLTEGTRYPLSLSRLDQKIAVRIVDLRGRCDGRWTDGIRELNHNRLGP